MKRWIPRIAVLCVVAVLVAAGAAADDGPAPSVPPSAQAASPIPATADTDTSGGTGKSANLAVAYYDSDSSTGEIFSLLRFEVASALPANAVIDSAVMSIYLWGIGDETNPLPVEVPAYLVRSPWDEYTVSLSNQPSLWPWTVSSSIDYPAGWKHWDITTWARNWLADPAQNYGAAIRGLRTSTYWLFFYSRESTQRPFLNITYHTVPICDIVTQIPRTECQALVDLYNGAGGSTWSQHTHWLVTTTPCSWYGVTCSGAHVSELNLASNNLAGGIPSTLGDLSGLQELRLSANRLTGSIPATLGSLPSLQILNLSNNQLTGIIPTSLGSLSSLEGLWLHTNQLNGTIPSSLGNLSNLTVLSLHSNSLYGSIPASLGNLSSLMSLELHHNYLSGSIPATLGSLSNLQSLTLHRNQLTGNIPAVLGKLSNLTNLLLSNNQLSGNIPTNLGSLTNLETLHVDNNPLSGELPLSLQDVPLTSFWFNNTNLCEPADAAFQSWLAGIASLQRTNAQCSTSTATPGPRTRTYLPVIMKQSADLGPTSTPTHTPTCTPTAGAIFSDNFNDGLLTGWTANKGVWSNPGAAMRGEDTDPPGYEIRHVKSATGANFVYEATVNLVEGYAAGLIFRASADGTMGYEVGLSTVDNQFRLGVLTPGYVSLANAPVAVEWGRAYRIKVVADGSMVEVYLDGAKLLSATDTQYASGRFGVIVRGGYYTYRGIADFDDLEAWALP